MNERLMWETSDGRRLYKASTSHHHVAFERKAYTTRLERLYRGMGGMVLLLESQDHRELHANVKPPIKPSHDLMSHIYHHSRPMEYEDQYDLFNKIVEHVGRLAQSESPLCEEAVRLHENWLDQLVFIEQGKLTPVERMVA